MKNILKTSVKNISITFVILFSITSQSFSEGLFDGPGLFDTPKQDNSGNNSFYTSDGSLVIVRNAQDSGLIIKDDGDGAKTEYYVVPKKGENTFIYNDGLTI